MISIAERVPTTCMARSIGQKSPGVRRSGRARRPASLTVMAEIIRLLTWQIHSQPLQSLTMQNSSQRTKLVVLVTIGAAFMSSLDLFVVNVAFDDIGRDLGVGRPGGPSAADLSWVLNAYAVVFAALLVPFGRLADRYGRKRLFVAGLAIFVLASAACAASGDVWSLVGFRTLQAAGAAAMTPTSLSILMGALP